MTTRRISLGSIMRVVAFMLALSALASEAGAATARAVVLSSRSSSAFASVGVLRSIDARLAEVTRSFGYALAGVKLDDAEQICREADCLPKLAGRHNVDVLLAATINPNPVMGGDVVQVMLFRRAYPDAVRTEQELCTRCDARRAIAIVADLGARLLRSDPGTGAPPLEPVRLLPVTNLEERASLESRRRVYRALGFTSVGLLAGSVALTIAMAVVDGGCADRVGDRCREQIDATAGIAVGAAGAGLFAVGAGVLLYLGYRPLPERVSIAPILGRDHAGLTLRYGF